jgi:hypothetical protein
MHGCEPRLVGTRLFCYLRRHTLSLCCSLGFRVALPNMERRSTFVF